LLQLPAGVQRLLADREISAGHARALLGTPDRSLQENLAKRTVADGLTVRALEELVRQHVQGIDEEAAGLDAGGLIADGSETQGTAGVRTPRRRLPAPGVIELEELLSAHLNTRVKVDMSTRKGKVIVEFATLEDLERIYKLMVGTSSGG
jgi:ParB family chromosome partitioning protein